MFLYRIYQKSEVTTLPIFLVFKIKKQQHELDCHREELKYRKNDMFERNRKQREMFRKGYWD